MMQAVLLEQSKESAAPWEGRVDQRSNCSAGTTKGVGTKSSLFGT